MGCERQHKTKGKHAMSDANQTRKQEAEMLRNAMNEFNHIMTINRTDDIVAAFSLACKAHAGQKDKSGRAYIAHPMTVASNVGDDETCVVVALLHDIVEDGNVSLDEIRKEFGNDVADAVALLTHDDDLTYGQYIDRIATSGNDVAIRVKIADLSHNMCVSRIACPSHGDADRAILRYAKAYTKLVSALCDGKDA